MAQRCSAWYCINTVQDVALNPDLRFYELPRGRGEMRAIWELALKSGHRGKFTAKAFTYVCSDHFEDWCFGSNKTLIKDAVPTLFYLPTHDEEVAKDDNTEFRKRRLRKIFLENCKDKSMSFFVLPEKFAQPLKSGKAMPRSKKGQEKAEEVKEVELGEDDGSREFKYKKFMASNEEDFGEYDDYGIFDKGGAEKRRGEMEEEEGRYEGEEILKGTFEIPTGLELKECSILMQPLEDLARKQKGVYATVEKKTSTTLDPEANVLYEAPARKARTQRKRGAPKKESLKRKPSQRIKELLRTKPYQPKRRMVEMDHGYGRDPRFEGCEPESDPYKLRWKMSELVEKAKKQQRLLKKAEDKTKRAEMRLKLAEEAIAEYEKREHTLSVLPAQNLDNPVVREVVLCILKNSGTKIKQYSDTVKDFCRAMYNISPKAYNLTRLVLALPSARVIKEHCITNNPDVIKVLNMNEEEEEPRRRRPGGNRAGVGGAFFMNREAAIREGKAYPLVVTEDEYNQAIPNPVDFSQYDDVNRETEVDPEEDGYETSLLINPPVELGAPGQPALQPQTVYQVQTRVVRTKGKAGKRKQEYIEEDSEELEEDSEDDVRGKRIKVIQTKRGKRIPARIQAPLVQQSQPQFVHQVTQQGFEVVTTSGGQQWANPGSYYQMEHSAGGVHYVQALPMQVDAQNPQYITADISKIIDMSGYQ